MKEQEEWRDIPGYEGRYQASSAGRIRSVDNYVRCGYNGAGRRLVKGRILRPGVQDEFGHVSVALGRGNSKGVHTLVALTFLGPRPRNADVAHRNGMGGDNRLGNLRWATRSQNNHDSFLNGRYTLEPYQVAEIKRRLSAPLKFGDKTAMAREFKTSQYMIWAIRVGKHYAHD